MVDKSAEFLKDLYLNTGIVSLDMPRSIKNIIVIANSANPALKITTVKIG